MKISTRVNAPGKSFFKSLPGGNGNNVAICSIKQSCNSLHEYYISRFLSLTYRVDDLWLKSESKFLFRVIRFRLD